MGHAEKQGSGKLRLSYQPRHIIQKLRKIMIREEINHAAWQELQDGYERVEEGSDRGRPKETWLTKYQQRLLLEEQTSAQTGVFCPLLPLIQRFVTLNTVTGFLVLLDPFPLLPVPKT